MKDDGGWEGGVRVCVWGWVGGLGVGGCVCGGVWVCVGGCVCGVGGVGGVSKQHQQHRKNMLI